MAQFGKHLFGASYFGKTSTFNGQYETPVIDAGKPFDGRVNVVLDALRPTVTYAADDGLFAYQADRWSPVETGRQTTQAGSTVSFIACGSQFTLTAQGSASVTFKAIDSQTETTHTFTDSFNIDQPFADYQVTVTAQSTPFTWQGASLRVTDIGVEVRSASTLADTLNFIPAWGSYASVPLTVNSETGELEGQTAAMTSQRYVQLRLHLASSDGDVSPVMDALHFSSGDLSEHAPSGYWYCSLNMQNIASGISQTFERVKRVRWKEQEHANSRLTLRSTSVSGSPSGHPTRTQIADNSYWKAETAPYLLQHDGQTFGTPWSRISLAEQSNGFVESSHKASAMIGPLNPKQANLTNTQLVRWLDWQDRAYYPTNTHGTDIVYELYKNKNDIVDGYAPIYRVHRGQHVRDSLITLAKEDQTDNVWLRIQLERIPGRQSPVVDQVDLRAQMHYESAAATARFTDTLSPLDGATPDRSARGQKALRNLSSGLYDWPSLTQAIPANAESLRTNPRRVRLSYTPRYLNQVRIGLGPDLQEDISFDAATTPHWTVYSQTSADTPTASTHRVSVDRLVWHASYDGGTVNFPVTTDRDLTGDFTPQLLDGKRYRFYLQNGWGDETFTLPMSMPWSDIESITGHSQADIEAKTGTVKVYNGRVPMGYTLTLPNTSKNETVNLQFKATASMLTEQSFWNGEQNDTIEAWIDEGGQYAYTDWVSDELVFDGVLNPNDAPLPYVRTQSSVMNARNDSTYTVTDAEESAQSIANRFAVDVHDLKLRNNNTDLFAKDDTVIIPGTFSLPSLAPGLIYEGENPYVIEVVPGSTRKTFGNIRLSDDILIPGTDDEPAIQYTLVDSPAKTGEMTRGSIRHGADLIPFTNTREVLRVVDQNGQVYVPYVAGSGSEMGDFILQDNRIDWSPSHGGAKEPEPGVTYTVTVIHGIVNTLRLIYSTDYTEKMAVDRLWRSTDAVIFDGVVTPQEDVLFDLPDKDTFAGWHTGIKDSQYVVEDNDLWVQTSILDQNGEPKLFATLNGEDPAKNWYPTIQTGFYYLNEQEYYLYSEPRKQVFEEKDVPITENVTYSDDGLQLGIH